jgi:hypothetical protein
VLCSVEASTAVSRSPFETERRANGIHRVVRRKVFTDIFRSRALLVSSRSISRRRSSNIGVPITSKGIWRFVAAASVAEGISVSWFQALVLAYALPSLPLNEPFFNLAGDCAEPLFSAFLLPIELDLGL